MREPDDGLVGRERALRVLRSAWDDARAGRLQVVVIDGDAGTGKTALARDAAAFAASTGGIVGLGTAHELAGAPPYWPWTSALRDLGARGGHDALDGALRDVAGGELVRSVMDAAGAVDAPQFAVFDAFARVLERLGREAPVLVVLDDAHWADQASLDLVQFVARAQPRGRVAVLVACRSLAADDRVSAMVASIVTEPSVRRLTVGALDPADVHRLVERRAGGPVDAVIARAIADRTAGNPWLVEELVRQLLVEDGELDVSNASVPDTVRALTRARAARLDPHAVDVLTIASFAAGDFDGAVAQRMLGLDASDVAAVLDDAAREGLVVDALGRPGWYRFANSLVRHAFYDAVPPRRRAETHVAIARVLVDLLGSQVDRRAAELAAHFSQGIDAGGAADAVQWLRRAAAQAARSNAYGDATRHLRRALFVTRSRLDDPRLECEVLIELARAARLAADPSTAQLARDRAQRLAVRLGDDALVVRAASPVLGPGPHWLRRAP